MMTRIEDQGEKSELETKIKENLMERDKREREKI